MQILLLPLNGHAHLAETVHEAARHREPVQANSWTRVRNSQEDQLFLTVSGVGTRSPTWTTAVSVGNMHPS